MFEQTVLKGKLQDHMQTVMIKYMLHNVRQYTKILYRRMFVYELLLAVHFFLHMEI